MKRWICALFLAIVSITTVNAQRSWFEFEISKELSDKLEISLAPEIRFKENFELQQYFFEPKIEYSFNKYFSLGANYRVGNNPDKDGNAQWFGRYAVEGKTKYDWKKLEAQFRLRYTNFDDFGGEESDRSNYLRMKFQLEYDIKKLDLKPYALYEVYRNLAQGDFTKARWEGGLQYKINKHHRVGAYFRFNDYLVNDDESVKILGLAYKYKF
ncbi:DUF2490 domain-containing protein [Maribellus sediminis]|uniref:DUF2490 domain-containing protein n=1 Tax=Maribellus sediminis TaxID=2696285 RepID=UPI0014300944|nr:DUF2490 domain-containing protein [Maribellus sediminis]